MLSTLVLLAGLAGQQAACGPTGCPPNTDKIALAPSGLHRLADASGKVWSSPDPAWLEKWVGIVNKQLGARDKTKKPLPTGVVASRLPHLPAGQSWYGGNVGIEKGGAIGATEDEGPDLYLTVIGPTAERRQVLDAIEKSPELSSLVSSLGDRLAIHDYAPDDPMASDVGLPDGGRPDVVIQDKSGKVRFRAHDNPGPAVLVAELRKADPKYDPTKDPAGGWDLKGIDRFFGNAEEQAPILAALAFLGFAVWWTRS